MPTSIEPAMMQPVSIDFVLMLGWIYSFFIVVMIFNASSLLASPMRKRSERGREGGGVINYFFITFFPFPM